MDDLLSTKQLGWILDRSPSSVREMIRDGDIEATRLPGGFRVPKAEVLRIARERIESEAGRTLSDRELERLIDQVLATNEVREA
ncbi:MAG: helix-turn-helix domain-containing protein [Chloroflexota bacterium]